jgi:hypothetical protein
MQHQKIAIVLKIPQPFTCEYELGVSSMHQINTNHRSRFKMDQPSVCLRFSECDDQETRRNTTSPTFPLSKDVPGEFSTSHTAAFIVMNKVNMDINIWLNDITIVTLGNT